MGKVEVGYRLVNRVMTKYLTIGGGVDSKPKKVILVIPGMKRKAMINQEADIVYYRKPWTGAVL